MSITKELNLRIYQKSYIDELQEKIEELENQLSKSSEVISLLKSGNIVDIEHKFQSEIKSEIELALIELQERLYQESENEKNRAWASEGMASFVEVLRLHSESSIDQLCDNIIKTLTEQLNCVMGYLYVIETNLDNVDVMQLKAANAYDRKKYIQQSIEKGEGLVGQCWYDMDAIYLTEIPLDYVKIATGMGETEPTCILIIPLLLNNKIIGVIELAALKGIQKFEVDFVWKISENIAATLVNAKSVESTKKMLDNANQFTSKLQQQEEEMKQNLEEMEMIQEQMLEQEKLLVKTLNLEFEEKEQKLVSEIERLNLLLKQKK